MPKWTWISPGKNWQFSSFKNLSIVDCKTEQILNSPVCVMTNFPKQILDTKHLKARVSSYANASPRGPGPRSLEPSLWGGGIPGTGGRIILMFWRHWSQRTRKRMGEKPQDAEENKNLIAIYSRELMWQSLQDKPFYLNGMLALSPHRLLSIFLSIAWEGFLPWFIPYWMPTTTQGYSGDWDWEAWSWPSSIQSQMEGATQEDHRTGGQQTEIRSLKDINSDVEVRMQVEKTARTQMWRQERVFLV